jgi:PAS domain S-box-containing protein
MKAEKQSRKRAGERDDARTLEVLFEISEAVSTTRNPEELYRVMHSSLGRILKVENFFIALHHEDRDSITFPYYVSEKDERPEEIFHFSKTASLTGKVIRARGPLIFYAKDIVDFARAQGQKVIGTVSKIWLGAPLIIKDRVIGVIALQSFNSPEDYTKKDLDLLTAVSQHIALAIERKESEEKLSEQKQVLEKILESSPVGICLVENRIFKWVNAEMVRMFGYRTKEAFENLNVRMIYKSDEDFSTAGKLIYTDLKKSGKSDFDFDLKRKDNTLFKAHVIITSPRQENPLESTIVTIVDISGREEAQKEKMKREKLQGVLEMAGAICHEINQPLQTILGYSTLFEDNEAISPEDLQKIKKQAIRIGDITRRLSNITRYKTVEYPGDTRIIDIWGSGPD